MTTSPPVATLKRSSGVSVIPNIPDVEGVAGVDVGDTPVDAIGEFLVRVGRIIGFLWIEWRGRYFLAWENILGHSELREAASHQREADGRQTRERYVKELRLTFHGGPPCSAAGPAQQLGRCVSDNSGFDIRQRKSTFSQCGE